jgi:hypothetical protein
MRMVERRRLFTPPQLPRLRRGRPILRPRRAETPRVYLYATNLDIEKQDDLQHA